VSDLSEVALYRRVVLLTQVPEQLAFSEAYWEECVYAVKRET